VKPEQIARAGDPQTAISLTVAQQFGGKDLANGRVVVPAQQVHPAKIRRASDVDVFHPETRRNFQEHRFRPHLERW
jgi:hypothetical protein